MSADKASNYWLHRPLPYPTYGTDHSRIRLEKSRLLIAVALVIFGLLPSIAGPNIALELPVMFTRIDLPRRDPALIQLDLPGVDFMVSPASLGYFNNRGQFVYTADVTRGLLYGARGKRLYVAELNAAEETEIYLDSYLEEIRHRVDLMNDRQNLLYLEREAGLDIAGDPESPLAELIIAAGPDFSNTISKPWLEQFISSNSGQLLHISAELTREARHVARLKMLYYQVQEARLDLLLSQFYLQAALARLPSQDNAGLLHLGDTASAQQTMLGEIGRLRDAWSLRKALLTRRTATDRIRLARIEFGSEPLVPTFLGDAGTNKLFIDQGNVTAQFEDIAPEEQFEISLIQARLTVANAELDMIAVGMEKLESAVGHVEQGVSSLTDLPLIEVGDDDFSLLAVDNLNTYAIAKSTTHEDEMLQLLGRLACNFDGEPYITWKSIETPWNNTLFQPSPDEVAYGLLAVDLWEGPLAAGEGDFSVPVENPEAVLADSLTEVIENPEEHTPLSLHLGYLRFIRWYAGLKAGETY